MASLHGVRRLQAPVDTSAKNKLDRRAIRSSFAVLGDRTAALARLRLVAAPSACGNLLRALIAQDIGARTDIERRQIHTRDSPIRDADLLGKLVARLSYIVAEGDPTPWRPSFSRVSFRTGI
jgi:hypothetical protein